MTIDSRFPYWPVLAACAVASAWIVFLVMRKMPADAPMADSETGVAAVAAPETDPEGAAPKMAAVVHQLADGRQIRVGLHRVTVDGRTFLVAVSGTGVAIVEYVPEGADE